jgi:hypothetical protein
MTEQRFPLIDTTTVSLEPSGTVARFEHPGIAVSRYEPAGRRNVSG